MQGPVACEFIKTLKGSGLVACEFIKMLKG